MKQYFTVQGSQVTIRPSNVLHQTQKMRFDSNDYESICDRAAPIHRPLQISLGLGANDDSDDR